MMGTILTKNCLELLMVLMITIVNSKEYFQDLENKPIQR